jgi:HEAT repeat protein
VIERLLPDARLDDSLADVIRQMDVREVCDVIAEGLGGGDGALEGILRAIRDLAAITSEDRASVAAKAHAALVAAGASESEAASLVEAALPTQLRANPNAEAGDSRLATEIQRIAEAMWRTVEISPEEIAGLREEATAGLTDGDVVFTLVTLLANERRHREFAKLMESVEDGLGMLVDWGEYEAAATSAAALVGLTRAEDLTGAERERAAHALVGMATSARLQKVAGTMRVFRAGSPENTACRRLLEVLGEHAISPLLEVLARESDMSARKQIIDIISGVAAQHVSALGRRVGDPQWFVVRNVVSILGATRDPAALPYLPGPLRHADTRVRRETIRALANIRDGRSVELLTAALNDADQQNVQLAARHLGAFGAAEAVDALAAVAAGDTRAARDVTPRIEAIEALGEIGGSRAEGVLADIASKRSILGGGRFREVRAAAAATLARVRDRAPREAESDA